MKIQRKNLGDDLVLEIDGVIDAENSPQLKKTLTQSIDQGVRNFILNFKKVKFIDSTGLGVLISLIRRLAENDGRFRLAGLQEEVKSIFEITRLYRVIKICPDLQTALDEINKEKP